MIILFKEQQNKSLSCETPIKLMRLTASWIHIKIDS